MIRLSDARPLTKVAIIAGILAAALLACALCAVLVALVGLKQIGPQMDVSAVPAWLWYYRGDPLLHLWLRGLFRSPRRSRVAAFSGIARDHRCNRVLARVAAQPVELLQITIIRLIAPDFEPLLSRLQPHRSPECLGSGDMDSVPRTMLGDRDKILHHLLALGRRDQSTPLIAKRRILRFR